MIKSTPYYNDTILQLFRHKMIMHVILNPFPLKIFQSVQKQTGRDFQTAKYNHIEI